MWLGAPSTHSQPPLQGPIKKFPLGGDRDSLASLQSTCSLRCKISLTIFQLYKNRFLFVKNKAKLHYIKQWKFLPKIYLKSEKKNPFWINRQIWSFFPNQVLSSLTSFKNSTQEVLAGSLWEFCISVSVPLLWFCGVYFCLLLTSERNGTVIFLLGRFSHKTGESLALQVIWLTEDAQRSLYNLHEQKPQKAIRPLWSQFSHL